MHFEILVEDASGKTALDVLVPKIIGEKHTFRIYSYKGIGGKIPKDIHKKADPTKRILLDNLPRLLQGYGKKHDPHLTVVVVCDLDTRCLKQFRQELDQALRQCAPRPEARFCIAVEEMEAWFLGNDEAILKAYPKAKTAVLKTYRNDDICSTWERLADAVYPDGANALRKKGWQAVGAEKSRWASAIAPHIDISRNRSPSFAYFCENCGNRPDSSA